MDYAVDDNVDLWYGLDQTLKRFGLCVNFFFFAGALFANYICCRTELLVDLVFVTI